MNTLTKVTSETVGRQAARHARHRVLRFKSRGASLGLADSSTTQLIQQIERGFSFDAMERFVANTGVSLFVLGSIIGIPDRTLARRRSAGRLASGESERLLRIANVFEKAVAMFDGDAESAGNWLTTPKKALGGETPLLYSRTELGAREVENLIGRVEHGVFS